MPNNHQATIAAIRTAYGHRLTAADYRELLNLHSVAEVVSYLKNTEGYGELLSGLDPQITHRGHLEMLLKRSLFMQCLHFCSLERLRNTPFFRFFIYDYEVRELVKKLLLLSDGPQAYISAMDTWLMPYLSLSAEKLAKAENLREVADAAEGTPYAAVLRSIPDDPMKRNYTAHEIALRACYLERIKKEAAQTLHGADLEALNGLVGEQIDLINLINAYRLKRVFHPDAESLRSMMLPVSGRLPQRICEQLYAAPDLASFIEIVKTTRYGRMLTGLTVLSDQPESVRLEHALQSLRYRNARNALHFSGHAAVSMYAVHFLYQTEIQNLITIIEGIRYGKPVSYMQELLILE
ncbi:MAG: V-type ATPase subunit [Oscillospiraceae bacterium]|nr:V-type ATPase subunit [Oscillospiraceae bacterium]